jgi:hypothetical protein
MAVIDGNEVINGLYGEVYDENGQPMQTTQEFESQVELEKEEIYLPGVFMKIHKVMGGKGTGSMTFLKVDSRLQAKLAANPMAKFNYMGKLADPTARGEESILYRGLSFDSVPLMAFSMGELAEVEVDFTFEAYEFKKTIS